MSIAKTAAEEMEAVARRHKVLAAIVTNDGTMSEFAIAMPESGPLQLVGDEGVMVSTERLSFEELEAFDASLRTMIRELQVVQTSIRSMADALVAHARGNPRLAAEAQRRMARGENSPRPHQ